MGVLWDFSGTSDFINWHEHETTERPFAQVNDRKPLIVAGHRMTGLFRDICPVGLKMSVLSLARPRCPIDLHMCLPTTPPQGSTRRDLTLPTLEHPGDDVEHTQDADVLTDARFAAEMDQLIMEGTVVHPQGRRQRRPERVVHLRSLE